MNAFQWVALPLLGFLFIGSLVSALRGRGPRRVALFWAAIWLAAGVSIASPELTRDLARMVGIDRGADLVFYCAILAMFIGFFMVYVRLRRLEGAITKLTRHVALESPALPGEFKNQNSKFKKDAPSAG